MGVDFTEIKFKRGSPLRRYGVVGLLRLARDLVFTRLIFRRSARLVRQPFYFRGGGKLNLGAGLTTGVGVRIDVFAGELTIGKNLQLNDHVHIAVLRSMTIGDDVLIASRVFISDHNHGRYDEPYPGCGPDTPPEGRPTLAAPVIIEDRVWIGEQVCILAGVRIGQGAIIGAGAIVNRDVAPETIVAGAPAKVVRIYDHARQAWTRPSNQ
jgi:lipopolysaccharide O-acetyltransferase